MSAAERFLFDWLAFAVIVSFPVLNIWGWVRVSMKRPEQWDVSSVLSLTGFSLATASGLLAVEAVMYAQATHGFAFWDPRLIRICAVGAFVALMGLAAAFGGVRRPSPVRWHAPACSVGMLLFWFLMAMMG